MKKGTKGFLEFENNGNVHFRPSVVGNVTFCGELWGKQIKTKLDVVEAMRDAHNDYQNRLAEISREYNENKFSEMLIDMGLI